MTNCSMVVVVVVVVVVVGVVVGMVPPVLMMYAAGRVQTVGGQMLHVISCRISAS